MIKWLIRLLVISALLGLLSLSAVAYGNIMMSTIFTGLNIIVMMIGIKIHRPTNNKGTDNIDLPTKLGLTDHINGKPYPGMKWMAVDDDGSVWVYPYDIRRSMALNEWTAVGSFPIEGYPEPVKIMTITIPPGVDWLDCKFNIAGV